MNDNNINEKLDEIEKEKIPPKKPRGRPKKLEPIIEEPIVPTEEFIHSIKQLGGIILDLAAPRLPNPIPFTDQEKDMFNKALSKVALKYYINIGKWEEEATLILITGVLLYPRFRLGKKKSTKEKTDKKKP